MSGIFHKKQEGVSNLGRKGNRLSLTVEDTPGGVETKWVKFVVTTPGRR